MATVPASSTWVPETRYARNGEVHIAYQVFGGGDVTLVGLPGIISNIEVFWEEPDCRRHFTGLGSICRNVIYDKRGQGMSDRDAGVPTLDERVGDLAAVIDAVDAERVALLGVSEGGSTAALFAATHPDRVSHLMLFGSFARPDVAAGDVGVPRWAEGWATPDTYTVGLVAPSKEGDPDFLRWINHLERQSGSPASLLASWRWVREIDIRSVLGSIRCPTLVIHSRRDRLVNISLGRELAAGIPGARLVELEGDDHAPPWAGDVDELVSLYEEFLTGRRPAPRPAERVLATVLLTDIVDSTGKAATIGDAAWKRLLDRHDEISRRTIVDFGGRFVKETGDGVLATFDAPGRALQCADTLCAALGEAGIAIRAGVHTGEIELRNGDVSGIGVHIAARVNAIAGTGEVLVSRTVKDLVAGSGYAFANRGMHRLKGVPDEWELLAVETSSTA